MRWAYILAIVVGITGFTGDVAYAAEKVEYHARDYKALYYIRHHLGKVPQCDRYARSIFTLEDTVWEQYGSMSTKEMNYVTRKGIETLLKYAPKHEARANKCLAKYKKGWTL